MQYCSSYHAVIKNLKSYLGKTNWVSKYQLQQGKIAAVLILVENPWYFADELGFITYEALF